MSLLFGLQEWGKSFDQVLMTQSEKQKTSCIYTSVTLKEKLHA